MPAWISDQLVGRMPSAMNRQRFVYDSTLCKQCGFTLPGKTIKNQVADYIDVPIAPMIVRRALSWWKGHAIGVTAVYLVRSPPSNDAKTLPFFEILKIFRAAACGGGRLAAAEKFFVPRGSLFF